MDMKKLAGDKAATYVKDGMVVGLGTGSTAYHMVNAVGEMVKNGLKIQAIPTSKARPTRKASEPFETPASRSPVSWTATASSPSYKNLSSRTFHSRISWKASSRSILR